MGCEMEHACHHACVEGRGWGVRGKKYLWILSAPHPPAAPVAMKAWP